MEQLQQLQRHNHDSERSPDSHPHSSSLLPPTLIRQPSPPLHSPTDFTIFTSIRYDSLLSSSQDNEDYSNRRRCQLYMPELHRQRLWKAAATFWPKQRFEELETTTSFETSLLRELEVREGLGEGFMCPMKLKYSFTQDGRTSLEIAPVPALPMEALFPTTFRLPSETRTPTKSSRFGTSNQSSPLSSPRYSPMPSPAPRYSNSSSRSQHSQHSQHSSSRRASTYTQEGDYFSSSGSSSHTSPSSGSSSNRKRSELPCKYEIWLDTAPTPQTQHTSFKSSLRECYNASRARALPVPSDMTQEVLLFNEKGVITEGSVLTPYFRRNGIWITPAVADGEVGGGQQGTSRRYALERGLCEEGVVERRSIRVGERVWLSNGVRGFGWGRVMASKRGDDSSVSSGHSL